MQQQAQEKQASWVTHIQSQKVSKLNQREYCDEHFLDVCQFSYWKKKLERKNKTTPILPTTSKKSTDFIPVSVQPQVTSTGLSITLPNGITLEGINSDNCILVQKLIGGLK
ncbi:MAG: hypothetical protein JKY54_09860 [Flavobacteriales bacterium]|nr:hypothetical protein [Flavobacteriales bacterium]